MREANGESNLKWAALFLSLINVEGVWLSMFFGTPPQNNLNQWMSALGHKQTFFDYPKKVRFRG